MVQSSVNLSVFSKNTLNGCPWQKELLYVKGDSAIIQCYSFLRALRLQGISIILLCAAGPGISKLQEAGHCQSCNEASSGYKGLHTK